MASLFLSPLLRKVNRTTVSSICTTAVATPLNTINKTLSGFKPVTLTSPLSCSATATKFCASSYFSGATTGKRFYAQEAFKHQEITDVEFTLLAQKFTDSLSSDEITKILIIVTPYVVSLLHKEAPPALKYFYEDYLARGKFLSPTTDDTTNTIFTSEGVIMKSLIVGIKRKNVIFSNLCQLGLNAQEVTEKELIILSEHVDPKLLNNVVPTSIITIDGN